MSEEKKNEVNEEVKEEVRKLTEEELEQVTGGEDVPPGDESVFDPASPARLFPFK